MQHAVQKQRPQTRRQKKNNRPRAERLQVGPKRRHKIFHGNGRWAKRSYSKLAMLPWCSADRSRSQDDLPHAEPPSFQNSHHRFSPYALPVVGPSVVMKGILKCNYSKCTYLASTHAERLMPRGSTLTNHMATV